MIPTPIRTAAPGASDPYAAHYARARRERALAVRAAFAALAQSLTRTLALASSALARRPASAPRTA